LAKRCWLKYVVLGLLVVIAVLGVMMVGHQDWVHKNEVVNSELYVTVLNSTLDVNVTNTSIDVNVTNSVLDVSVQGTANVEIQNAILNVQTLREQASENNKIDYYADSFNVPAYDSVLNVAWTNTNTYTVYLEMITFSVVKSNSSDPDIDPLNVEIWFEIVDDSGNEIAQFNINPPGKPINFDPAIPIPSGWKIEANVNNMGGSDLVFTYNYLFRTQ